MEDNKKTSILLILKILQKYSDENHYLTQQEIIDHIYSQYGIQLQRKSVSHSLDLLQQLGYDINSLPRKGVALLSRELDESQIKYLVDAIFSSKNITGKQALELTEALYSMLSIHQRKKYEYLYKSVYVNRSDNPDFFLNIEIINEAIAENKMIQFQYASYDKTGKEILKNGGHYYKISPYYLVNNFGKYYLLCNYNKFDSLSTYRVDFIRNVSVIEEQRKPMKNLIDMPEDFNITDYINDHVYLFSGKVKECKIRIRQENVIRDIMDWFGKNASLENQNDETVVTIRCDENAFYYWALQYGENIDVLEPLTLVNRLSHHYKEMAERYKTY